MILGAIVVSWSHPLVRWFALVMALSHAVGGSTWLANLGGFWGWTFAVGYLFVAAEVTRWCWHQSVLSP